MACSPSNVKKAVFVLGTLEYRAVRRGESITNEALALLDRVAGEHVDATIVFSVQDPLLAGKNRAKIKMATLHEERPRVLSEIGDARPDFVVCFGPVATACVFGKGNLVEGEMLRQEHHPLGAPTKCKKCNGYGGTVSFDAGEKFQEKCESCNGEGTLPSPSSPPVFVTFGLENVRYKAGLEPWLVMDVAAAADGWRDTVWGDYTVLLPGTPEWGICPTKLGYGTWVPGAIGFDLETYPAFDPWHPDARIRMAVISDRVGRAWVIQATPDSGLPQWVYDLIGDPAVVKAGSNIKFDYKWMRRFGHIIVNMHDTSTAEHIIDESNPKKDLKSLTFRYVPRLGDYSKGQRAAVKAKGGWEFLTDEEQYQYAGGDGEASIGTYLGQKEIIRKLGLERPHSLYLDLYPVLCDMEHHGAAIDLVENARLDALYTEKLAGLRQEIVAILGPVNPDAHAKLAEALKKAVPKINLSLWKRVLSNDEDEEISTKREVLEREAHLHPIISKVLEYRKYRVRRSTFLKAPREKHASKHSGGVFLHTNFNTARVETYRLSSSSPPLHSSPRKDNDDPNLTIKRQFVSRFAGGQVLEADQKQVEIRFAAWLSGDKKMLEAIASGDDIHVAMAAIMLDKPVAEVTEKERQECKARTFLILYGGGAAKLSRDLNITRRKAQRMINEYFATFLGLKAFIDRAHRNVRTSLHVETAFGFKRNFVQPEHWDSPDGWSIQRQAFNTLVQNGAACLTYCSMIWLHEQMSIRGLRSKLFLQVHDSMVVDVYPGELDVVARLVKHSMEDAAETAKRYGVDFDVPLACDLAVGPSWGETEALTLA